MSDRITGFRIQGLAGLDKDAWFIRLSDKKDFFLHPKEETQEGITYQVKQGTNGAGVWKKQMALDLIKILNYRNLEIVKVVKIIGPDSSMN